MNYSVVIPAHNESENLGEFVTKFIHDLPADIREILLEIIIVENGSTDGTWDACQRLHEAFPDIVVPLSNNRGSYGEAIKRGMLESRGSHLSILECDFLDTEFVKRSVELFQSGQARFIVASKRHPESVDQRPFKRRLLTYGFNLILNVALGYSGTDTHGLKSIETPLAKRLCELAITTDEIFQTEIVLMAWRMGIEIKELPIHILERRPAPVTIRKRFPMVMNTVRELRRSLRELPAREAQA